MRVLAYLNKCSYARFLDEVVCAKFSLLAKLNSVNACARKDKRSNARKKPFDTRAVVTGNYVVKSTIIQEYTTRTKNMLH